MFLLLLYSLLSNAAGFNLFQPEQFMGPLDIITHNGFPAEAHKVTTKDGYILTMHRIPSGTNGKRGARPVLLLPGLVCTSFEFLSQVPAKSLRNIYAADHKTFSPLEPRFWDFSWDEMSQYDAPAMIDYVLSVTNHSYLYFVGYSQGSLTLFAAAALQPEMQSKVKHHFALAPGMALTHLDSPLYKLAEFIPGIAQGVLSLVPSQVLSLPYLFPFCGRSILLNVCKFIIGGVVGPMDQIEESRLAVFTAHFPGGTSNTNLRHWLQTMKGTAHFDYGEEGNLREYGTTFPRPYNFSSYRIPTSLYYSPSDKLQNPENRKIALDLLPASSITRNRNLQGFSHLDFVWGNRAKAEIYDEIIADINIMEGK